MPDFLVQLDLRLNHIINPIKGKMDPLAWNLGKIFAIF